MSDGAPTCPECGSGMEFSSPVGFRNGRSIRGWGKGVTDLEWECPNCYHIGYTVARGPRKDDQEADLE